ncbi:LamG domain-containing protein, partial [Flavobacteriales bacterium]|nr:LamG domain-containing protein [Flavobacteriales bacterium]
MKNTILILFILFGFLKPNFSQVPGYVPSTGLVGWWPFNGNANDNSGNGNNGVVHGATLTTDRFGNSNNAYNFIVNATAGWGNAENRIVVSSPSIPNTNSFTMSSWVVVDSKPSPYANRASSIMGRWGGAGQEIFRNQIFNNTSQLSIYQSSAWSITTGTDTLNPQWNHICLTYDGSRLTHYLNGNVIYSNIINITLPTSSVDLTFGEIHMSNGHWLLLDGKLDDLGYWSVALDSCQVQNLYTGGSGSCCVTNFQFPQDTILYCGSDSVQLDAGSGWSIYSWNSGDSVQNPFVSTSGMYYVTVFDTLGCMGYDSVFLQKNNPTSSSSSMTACDSFTWPLNSVNYLAS